MTIAGNLHARAGAHPVVATAGDDRIIRFRG
jgi:hypothetical protein